MMPDREKVIKGLECCTMLATLEHPYRCKECPYQINGAPCERFAIMKDALALLKEQEPIEPIPADYMIEDNEPGWYSLVFKCGNCKKPLYGQANYCIKCGKAVKWG